MDERPEIPKEVRKRLSVKWPLRLIAIFAGAILLGFGLCKVDADYFPRQAAEEFGPNSWVGGVGFWVIVLSVIGLFGSFVALVILSIANATRND